MNVNEFMSQVVPSFEDEIIDLFFLYIQSDRILMKKYLDLVADTGNLQYVNSHIAQLLSQRFQLSNGGVRNDTPKSLLIQSYSLLKKEGGL